MNEQTKKFLNSVGIFQNWDNTNYLITEEQLLTLIKSVVKECADIANEHFGVEE